MNERRGLIVERSRNRTTAVTKSGEFVTWSDRRELMVGEEVVIPSPRLQLFVWRRLVPATALAVILVFMSFFGYQQYLYARPIMAYVTFDSAGETAGSIELAVNDRGLVRSATGLDEAGALALSKVDCQMKPVQAVLASLGQVLTEAEEVVVAFIPAETPPKADSGASKESRKEAKKEEKRANKVADLEKKVLTAVGKATGITLDSETRNEAKELGISAGRAASWALWKHGSDAGPGDGGPDSVVTPDHEGVPESPQSPKPGQGTQPGSQGKPNSYGQQGQPGAHDGKDVPLAGPEGGDAESILNAIKSTLPEIDLEELSKNDAKELQKMLDKVTKEWLKSVKQMTKDSPGHSLTPEPAGGQKQGGASGTGSKPPENPPGGTDKGSQDEPGKSDAGQGKGQAKPGSGGSKNAQGSPSKKATSKGPSSLAERLSWTSRLLRGIGR